MTAGERLARAIAARDGDALLAILAPDVDFRGMTPGTFWEEHDAGAVVHDVILGEWFEPSDRIEGIDAVETAEVGDRHRVTYRVRVTNPDGTFVVEQHAYYDVVDGRITFLRVACSGYRPITG